MRALRFDGTSPTLDPRAADPAPSPGEALIRPIRVGISLADLEALRQKGSPAFTPGSEFVGVVERLADSATKADRQRLEGKRVTGSPMMICGACDLCRAGLSAHCRTRRALGRPGTEGCLAERFRLPIANLFEVPAGLDDDHAVFAVPVADALHAAQVVRIEGKPFVTVLGDSAEGLLAAQVLARLNATVRLLGSHPARLSLCEKWGIAGIRHRHVDEAGRRQDQAVVVDCTGTAQGLATAMQLVRPRGKIVLTRPITGADLGAAVENEVELIGARSGSIPDALAMLTRREIDVVSLITRRAKLKDGVAALQAAADPEQIRVLVDV